MKTNRVNNSGQVTIPKTIRERFNIKSGTCIFLNEQSGKMMEIFLQLANKDCFNNIAGKPDLKNKNLISLMEEKKRERAF